MRSWLAAFSAAFVLSLAASAAARVDFSCKATIPAWMAESKVPAIAIGILEDGVVKETAVFGELSKGIPARRGSLFNVASLTKPVVALTALKLIDAGQWKLDEPLASEWIDPDLAADPRSQKLTPRIVLSHQTGFPNWRRKEKLAFT